MQLKGPLHLLRLLGPFRRVRRRDGRQPAQARLARLDGEDRGVVAASEAAGEEASVAAQHAGAVHAHALPGVEGAVLLVGEERGARARGHAVARRLLNAGDSAVVEAQQQRVHDILHAPEPLPEQHVVATVQRAHVARSRGGHQRFQRFSGGGGAQPQLHPQRRHHARLPQRVCCARHDVAVHESCAREAGSR